jgi:putative hydrolase of HD superfamily
VSSDLVALFGHLADLKRLKRTGWLDRGVPRAEVESVADHSLLTAVIAYVVACDDSELDASRVLALAAIHDLAESITGDPTPYDAASVPPATEVDALKAFFSVLHLRSAESKDLKRQREDEAMEMLISMMPVSSATTFRELWREYETQATAEARFVKQVDLLEAFLQSRDYADRYPDLPFDGFRLQALQEITHPVLARVRDARLDRPR